MTVFAPVGFEPETENEARILASLNLLPLVLADVQEEIETMIREIQDIIPRLSGSGTLGVIPLWTPDGFTLGNSIASQSGSELSVAGNLSVGTAVAGSALALLGITGVTNNYNFSTAAVPGTLQISVGSAVERFVTLANTGAGVLSLTMDGNLAVAGISSLTGNVNIGGATNVSAVGLNVLNKHIVANSGSFYSYGAGDASTANSEFIQLRHSGTLGELYISKLGTGVFRDFALFTSDIERLRVTAAGAFDAAASIRVYGADDRRFFFTPGPVGSTQMSLAARTGGHIDVKNTAGTTMHQFAQNGDVTFDLGTLYVDAVNNRVGVNDSTPTYDWELAGNGRVQGSGFMAFGGTGIGDYGGTIRYIGDLLIEAVNSEDYINLVAASGVQVFSEGATPGPLAAGIITASEGFNLGGRFIDKTTSLSANTTLGATHSTIFASAAGGSITLTLPAASGNAGLTYSIFKNDTSSNTVTIDGNGAETIGGQANIILAGNQGTSRLIIVCDGTNWKVKELHDAGAFTATFTGMTSTIQSPGRFVRSGNMVCINIEYNFGGTSNSTSFTITGIPAAICGGGGQSRFFADGIDNGVGTPMSCNFIHGTGVIQCEKGLAGSITSWTASGQKGLSLDLTFAYNNTEYS